MRIIIEGADRTGKSTFAKYLLEKHAKHSYIHCNLHDRTDAEFYKTLLSKQDVIFDRCFVGEMVYPKYFNRKGNMTREQFQDIAQFCTDNNIEVVILYDSPRALEKRSQNEPKEVRENIKQINQDFIDLATTYGFKLRRLDQVLNEY